MLGRSLHSSEKIEREGNGQSGTENQQGRRLDRAEPNLSSDRDRMARAASSHISRRGLSAAITVAAESLKKVEEKAVKLGTVAKDIASAMATTTEEKTAFWEPDPETGYYRPVTGTKEVDAADLRAEMLKQRMLQDD